MTLDELHKIINKPDKACEPHELHLKAKWKHNNAKAIFEITGLDVGHLLKGECTRDGIIISNPTERGPVYYV